MTDVIIRDLAAADRPQWEPLWQGYLRFYESSLPDEVSDLAFARMLDPAEPMFGLVAQREGRLLGIVNCVIHRATWTKTHYCYLEDLFVSSEARGLGVGRALIEAVYQRSDELGASRVYWLTKEDNATARLLYDKVAKYAGFIQYRRA